MALIWLDYGLIALYFAVVFFVGARAGKKQSSESFLIAERNLGAWESAASICASKTGAGLILSYLGLLYLYGMAALWFFLGYMFGLVLFYIFSKKLKAQADKKKYYTLADYFLHNYGKTAGYATAFALLLSYVVIFATQLIGGAKILDAITSIGYLPSLFAITAVIMTYIVIGGFKAVVKTDMLQYVALFGLTIVLAAFLIKNFVFVASDWTLSQIPAGLFVAFVIAGILQPFSSVELWQRVYATHLPSLKRSLIAATILYGIFGAILSLVGLAIKHAVVVTDPDMLLIVGFQQLLPVGMLGLGVVVLYAVVMSSADTYLFTAAAMFVQDFYDRIRRQRHKNVTVRAMRYTAFVVGILGFLAAAWFQQMLVAVYFYFGLNIGIALVVFISWVWKRIHRRTLTSGIVTGTTSVIALAPFYHDQTLFFAGVGGVVLGMLGTGAIRTVRKWLRLADD